MSDLLSLYADADFIGAIVALSPAVGVGLLLGFVVAIVGWVWGFVVRIGKIEP